MEVVQAKLKTANWGGERPGLNGLPIILVFDEPVFQINDRITNDYYQGQSLRVLSASGGTVVAQLVTTDPKNSWFNEAFLIPDTTFYLINLKSYEYGNT